MEEWMLSLLIWLVLPALLIALVMAFAFNVLTIILLFTWLGLGVVMIAPPVPESQ